MRQGFAVILSELRQVRILRSQERSELAGRPIDLKSLRSACVVLRVGGIATRQPDTLAQWASRSSRL